MVSNNPSTVFISRNLSEDSVFYQLVCPKMHVIGRSLLTFKPLYFHALPVSDWLFFYSKKGIQHCLSQLKNLSKLPSIGVMGQASADFLRTHYSLKAQFIGKGDPIATAEHFAPLVKGKKVLFVQAKNSKQSVQKLLQDSIDSEHLIVYDNQIKTDFELPVLDCLIFTSPLNVKAYFSKYKHHSTQKIISIGNVTTQALYQQGIDQVITVTTANEKALAIACLQIFT